MEVKMCLAKLRSMTNFKTGYKVYYREKNGDISGECFGKNSLPIRKWINEKNQRNTLKILVYVAVRGYTRRGDCNTR